MTPPNSHLLSVLTFLPLAGALALWILPRSAIRLQQHLTLLTTLGTFAISLGLLPGWDPVTTGFQRIENVPWVPQLGIHYHLGIDGLSLGLVLLTTFLMPVVVLGSYSAVEKRHRGFLFHLLFLETAMLGTFLSLNMALFYVFWEAMLIPMYFLIGIWGGSRRIYATVKFFLYTMAGSLLMLVAIAAIAFWHKAASAPPNFAYTDWLSMAFTPGQQKWFFAAFALAFLIKVPLFPFHTWLPDAHVEAPTAGSVILAGILLKMGTYGLARFAMPLFPEALAAFTPVIVLLAVIGIVYGALVATVQPDIKKLVAYSSVSHLGFVVLGLMALNPQGLQGAFLQMIGHGLSTGALFLLVGIVYERRHTRLIAEYGGLAKAMPRYAVFFVIATFSSIGVPGLNGFVGEFYILLGAFQSFPAATVIAATGVVLGAVYMLWMVRRVFFGALSNPANASLRDLSPRETVVLLAMIVPMFAIGLYPKALTDRMQPAIDKLLAEARSESAADARDPEGAASLDSAAEAD